MAREMLRLTRGRGEPPKSPCTVVVEYRRPEKLYDRSLSADEKLYEVFIDGDEQAVGYVQQVSVSTSRSPITSPIRWGIGHHMEWGWTRYHNAPERWRDGERQYNYPGLYSETRRGAVADMLGYYDADKVVA